MPVKGRFYDFQFMEGVLSQRLVVTEVDRTQATSGHAELRLELLDATNNRLVRSHWATQLPPRLRHLHSHWLCREAGVLVFRPPHFQDHATHFMAGVDSSSGALDVRRVPPQAVLRACHWTRLLTGGLPPLTDISRLSGSSKPSSSSSSSSWSQFVPELCDRLVVKPQQTACAIRDAVLSKFEEARFIHAYQLLSASQLSLHTRVC